MDLYYTDSMQKIVIGLFAHPDDEAFGVSPTLIKEIAEGAEVHLITLTAGENGTNPDRHPELGALRLEEWRRSGDLIGLAQMHHFGYEDGTLSNQLLLPIAERVKEIVRPLLASSSLPIEFMSFDMNGISGHIDHIVASRAAALVFYQLKAEYPDRLTRLRLRCLPEQFAPTSTIDWIYMDKGRSEVEINEIINACEYHEKILEVIRCHHSQRSDGEGHIARSGNQLGMNYFIVKE